MPNEKVDKKHFNKQNSEKHGMHTSNIVESSRKMLASWGLTAWSLLPSWMKLYAWR